MSPRFLVSVINKAYKALEDETTRQKCMDVVEEAKFKVDSAVRGHHVTFVGNIISLVYVNGESCIFRIKRCSKV